MRNTRWLRVGLLSLVAVGAASGAFLVACGDDDDGGGPGTDAGNDTNNVTDTGTDTNTPQPEAGPPAQVTILNAATDLGPNSPAGGLNSAIRICFALGPSEATAQVAKTLPPLPDRPAATPGVPVGLGGTVPNTGADLSQFVIVPYVMNAATLVGKGIKPPGDGTPGVTCDKLINAGDGGTVEAGPLGAGFTQNVDYWKLPALPVNTLAQGTSKLLILTGCTNDTAIANKANCGPANGATFDGTPGPGNLKVSVYTMDKTTAVPATELGVQYVNASAQMTNFLTGAALEMRPNIADNAAGANTRFFKGPLDGGPDAAGVTAVAFLEQTPLKTFPVVLGSDVAKHVNGAAGASSAIPLTGAGSTVEAISFAGSGGDGGPNAYKLGQALTFIAVGDPAATGAGNPKVIHFVAFPNNPVISTYAPYVDGGQ